MRKSFASPTLDNLVDLACRDGVDIRPTLLRVVTDLYVQKPAHSSEEEVQFVELALGLIDAVDEPTRAAVAARLAGYRGAPLAILARLGSIMPAAERARPNEPKPDEPKPNERKSSELDPIEAKAGETKPDLVELFFAATIEERRLILTNLDAIAEPTPRRAPVSGDVPSRLEAAALQHNAGEFGRILERSLGVSAAIATRIVSDPSGEPIVVAAKALGVKAAAFQRILLFLNPAIGQSIERVYGLAQLFDEITPAAADSMASIWRQGAAPRRARHEPLHWDDVHRSARSQASHSGHRLARSREPLPSRQRNDRR